MIFIQHRGAYRENVYRLEIIIITIVSLRSLSGDRFIYIYRGATVYAVVAGRVILMIIHFIIIIIIITTQAAVLNGINNTERNRRHADRYIPSPHPPPPSVRRDRHKCKRTRDCIIIVVMLYYYCIYGYNIV
jgi:hypothetical protein